jgi:hypothetical protein
MSNWAKEDPSPFLLFSSHLQIAVFFGLGHISSLLCLVFSTFVLSLFGGPDIFVCGLLLVIVEGEGNDYGSGKPFIAKCHMFK